MYEEHFGLSYRPFGETVSPAAYVALPSRDVPLRGCVMVSSTATVPPSCSALPVRVRR